MPQPKRSRGRPREYPSGAKPRRWFATDAEFAALAHLSGRDGTTVQKLVRIAVLKYIESQKGKP